MTEIEKPIALPKVLNGTVTSTKMKRTVTVRVTRKVKHALYGKYILRSKKYHAHVEEVEAHDGDEVEIRECRPLSKTKTWRVTKILSRSPDGTAGRSL